MIYKALIKYGYSNFSLDIMEYCEPNVLISKEQYYIDILKPEYNILKIAGSNLGFKHTELAKTKMSAKKLGINHHFYGKRHTDETRKKISIAKKGHLISDKTIANMQIAGKLRRGKKHSMKIKATISIKNSISIKIININTGDEKIVIGYAQVMKYLNISKSMVYKCKKGGKPVFGKYLIKNV